jgi:hypothetical protein
MDEYVYKITNDDGAAPCVYDGVLSLANCKPPPRIPAETLEWSLPQREHRRDYTEGRHPVLLPP